MADALSWLRQMLGGGQGEQPQGGSGQALQQLQDRLASADQVQTPPQTWPWDLSKLTGMPSALEQSAAATAANPWQPGMTAGQVLTGRPEDPLAGSFQPGVGVGAIKAYHGSPYDFERFNPETSKPGFYGRGTYFHGAEADALKHKFSADAPEGGKMYEADLNTQRTFDMQKPVSAEDAAAVLEQLGKSEQAAAVRESGKGYGSGSELWYWGMGQNTAAEAKANAVKGAGFDAIVANPSREMTGQTKYSDIINVLDPSIIQMLRKYGLLPPLAAGGLLSSGSEPPT